jgi:hypothetical protein
MVRKKKNRVVPAPWPGIAWWYLLVIAACGSLSLYLGGFHVARLVPLTAHIAIGWIGARFSSRKPIWWFTHLEATYYIALLIYKAIGSGHFHFARIIENIGLAAFAYFTATAVREFSRSK